MLTRPWIVASKMWTDAAQGYLMKTRLNCRPRGKTVQSTQTMMNEIFNSKITGAITLRNTIDIISTLQKNHTGVWSVSLFPWNHYNG